MLILCLHIFLIQYCACAKPPPIPPSIPREVLYVCCSKKQKQSDCEEYKCALYWIQPMSSCMDYPHLSQPVCLSVSAPVLCFVVTQLVAATSFIRRRTREGICDTVTYVSPPSSSLMPSLSVPSNKWPPRRCLPQQHEIGGVLRSPGAHPSTWH